MWEHSDGAFKSIIGESWPYVSIIHVRKAGRSFLSDRAPNSFVAFITGRTIGSRFAVDTIRRRSRLNAGDPFVARVAANSSETSISIRSGITALPCAPLLSLFTGFPIVARSATHTLDTCPKHMRLCRIQLVVTSSRRLRKAVLLTIHCFVSFEPVLSVEPIDAVEPVEPIRAAISFLAIRERPSIFARSTNRPLRTLGPIVSIQSILTVDT